MPKLTGAAPTPVVGTAACANTAVRIARSFDVVVSSSAMPTVRRATS
jgi:hypothetical protein